MNQVVIVGAGGHAREVLDILFDIRRTGGDAEPIGFVDDNPELHGRVLAGVPVLGSIEWLKDANPESISVVCAVGTPRVQRILVQRVNELGFRFAQVISPRSYISSNAQIGQGVSIFPNAVVNSGAIIGDHVTLNVAATVSHDTVVKPYSNINPGVHLAGNVLIGEGCYIGMGANIIQGTSVDVWSVIGAGSVVVRNIPGHVTAVGVPARVVKTHNNKTL